MNEQQWTHYLALLAQAEGTFPSACVGCWYEEHPGDEAFPGDQVSSSLCHTHRLALPPAIKPPDTLPQRRCA
jgi:hypothetical protein